MVKMTPEETFTSSPVRLSVEEYLREKAMSFLASENIQRKVFLNDAFVAVQMAKGEAIDSMRPELEIFAKQVRERQIQEVREWLFAQYSIFGEKKKTSKPFGLMTSFDEHFLKVRK